MSKNLEKNKEKESEWDKKKIVFFLSLSIILLIVGLMVINSTFGLNSKKTKLEETVKGVSTKVDVGKNVQDKIQELQQDAGSINLVDIATSSPQVQKVINDLKALKDYPNNQLKQTCIDMCQKL